MIRIFGEDTELTQEKLNDIATYMNDDIREELHSEMAGECTPEEFLRAYIDKDEEFEYLVNNEFGIEDMNIKISRKCL